MQSKTSFCKYFNKTLFHKNMMRFWPLWAAPSLIGALFPLAYLTQMLRHHNPQISALEATSAYYEIIVYVLPILSIGYAVLVALAVWSYLFNSRSTSMMHTLPLPREGLFLTNFLSGMAMMLIPYAVTGALSIVIFACFGAFNPAGILVTVLAVIGESLFFFSSATVVAFITGNLFAMPVLYFIFHFLAVLMDFLVNLFAAGFLFGVNGDYSGTAEFLSPTVYLMTHVRCDRTYRDIFVPDAIYGTMTPDGMGYYDSELTAVSLQKGWVIAAYAAVGLILLGFAYVLYRKRRSESAGDVVSVGWMKPVFRYGVSICNAMASGLALYAIFWGNFQSGSTYHVIPLVFFMLLSGAIGYYIASMLLAKSLRVFRGSGKGLAVTALCTAVICGVMYFDVFGVETRVPTANQIDYVSFHAADNNYELYPEEDSALLEEVRKVHLAIAQDADYIRDMEDAWQYDDLANRNDISLYHTVRLNYYLKDGTSVSRRYQVPMTLSRMEDASTYDYALNQLINGQLAKHKRFHLSDDFTPENGDIYLDANPAGSVSFGNREAQHIMATVALDIANGTCGVYNWFENNTYPFSYAMDYAMDLSIQFRKPISGSSGETQYRYDHISIRVRPEMTNTVNALLQLGLIEKDHLKTRVELYPEDYSAEAQEWFDKYGYDAYETDSFPAVSDVMINSSPAASIGIIGGADGPTEVFVTGG